MSNNILKIAGSSTNILTQDEYLASPQLDAGFSGHSNSQLINKMLKQMSMVAAGMSQFIANNQPEDVGDILTLDEYAALFSNASKPGSFSGINTFAIDTILTNSDQGQLWAAMDDNINLSLPLSADALPGVCFTVYGNGYSNVTVNTQGSDKIANGLMGLTLTNVTLMPYDTCSFVCFDAGVWLVFGGNTQLSGCSTFKYGLGANGYAYGPGGVLEQWGIATIPAAATSVTFPIAFPTACWIVSGTDQSSIANSIGAYGYTNSQFTAIAKNVGVAVTTSFAWYAKGH